MHSGLYWFLIRSLFCISRFVLDNKITFPYNIKRTLTIFFNNLFNKIEYPATNSNNLENSYRKVNMSVYQET